MKMIVIDIEVYTDFFVICFELSCFIVKKNYFFFECSIFYAPLDGDIVTLLAADHS